MRAVVWLLQGLPWLRKPRRDLPLMNSDWVSSVRSTCPPTWLWVLVIASYKLAVWNMEWVKAWSLLEETFLPQLDWSSNCAWNSVQALSIVLCCENEVKHVLAFELHLLLLRFLLPLGWLLCANTCLPEVKFKMSAQLKNWMRLECSHYLPLFLDQIWYLLLLEPLLVEIGSLEFIEHGWRPEYYCPWLVAPRWINHGTHNLVVAARLSIVAGWINVSSAL